MALSAVTCGSNILKSWAPPVVLVVNNLPANVGHVKDVGSVPGLGRSPGGGHDNPFQYSCLRIKWTEEPDIVKTQIFPLVLFARSLKGVSLGQHPSVHRAASFLDSLRELLSQPFVVSVWPHFLAQSPLLQQPCLFQLFSLIHISL